MNHLKKLLHFLKTLSNIQILAKNLHLGTLLLSIWSPLSPFSRILIPRCRAHGSYLVRALNIFPIFLSPLFLGSSEQYVKETVFLIRWDKEKAVRIWYKYGTYGCRGLYTYLPCTRSSLLSRGHKCLHPAKYLVHIYWQLPRAI